jgi:hypothetical protein
MALRRQKSWAFKNPMWTTLSPSPEPGHGWGEKPFPLNNKTFLLLHVLGHFARPNPHGNCGRAQLRIPKSRVNAGYDKLWICCKRSPAILVGYYRDPNRPVLFRGRHFEDVIITLCVRWYLRYSLSYRGLEEMMVERGLSVDHVTIWRWVQRYAPILNQRLRRELRQPSRSWKVDETYVKVAGKWAYLSRAVDSAGDTIDFPGPAGSGRE